MNSINIMPVKCYHNVNTYKSSIYKENYKKWVYLGCPNNLKINSGGLNYERMSYLNIFSNILYIRVKSLIR
jgi:hypothetical protein